MRMSLGHLGHLFLGASRHLGHLGHLFLCDPNDPKAQIWRPGALGLWVIWVILAIV
jgi:hypothetical protein